MMGKALETLAHNGMRDDVVEFLDVAIGCIDGLRSMSFAELIDKLDTIIEIGYSLLIIKGSKRAIGKDVFVKITVEITRKILTRQGEYNLVI